MLMIYFLLFTGIQILVSIHIYVVLNRFSPL